MYIKENDALEKCITLDVDDVIVNFREKAYLALKIDHNITLHWSEWYEHALDKLLGIPNDEILESFRRHELLTCCELNEWAKEFINEAYDKGIKVFALTARGWHPDGERLTNEYFEEKGLNITETIAIDIHESKGDKIKEIQEKYRIIAFVDDHPRHVTEIFTRSDLRVENVFIRKQACNKNFHVEGIKSIDSFKDLMYLLD